MASAPVLNQFMGELQRYCAHLCAGQYAPQRKFVREWLWGLLNARYPVVAEIARSLKERSRAGGARHLIQTEKRLCRNLASVRFDDALLRRRILEVVARAVGDGTGVTYAVDRGDVRKEWAHPERPGGMQYAAVVHDGSESTKGKPDLCLGYYYVGVQAVLPSGRTVPVCRRLYSRKEPGYLTENHTTLSVLEEAAPYLGGANAWLALDAGFDANVIFRGLEEAGYRNWVVRVKSEGNRKVFDAQGNLGDLSDLISTTQRHYRTKVVKQEGGRAEATFGVRTCYLRDDHGRRIGVRRSIVVYSTSDGDSEVALLVPRHVTREEAAAAVQAYERRWAIEEGFKREKADDEWGFSLERMRVRSFRGLSRIMLLTLCASLFLAMLAEEPVAERIVAMLQVFKVSQDRLYRLCRAIGQELLGRLAHERVRSLHARWLRHG